jgi:hypothetical protein
MVLMLQQALTLTRPRPIEPRTTYMVTRSCTQQQFLLRPDPETNNAFVYCLAIASQRFDVPVMMFNQLSNHSHEVVHDRHGNLPAFYHCFHTLLAKCVNRLRGRSENVFSSHQTNLVRLVDAEALVEKLMYVATNPVKHDLVATTDEWPGANGYRALLDARPIRATRPKVFFSKKSKLPAEVELKVEIPAELGNRHTILSHLVQRVRDYEAEASARRTASSTTILGRYAIRRQSWKDTPSRVRQKRGLVPSFAGRFWARVEAAQRKKDFEQAHAEALSKWLSGKPVQFPYGTYAMTRFAKIRDLSKIST